MNKTDDCDLFQMLERALIHQVFEEVEVCLKITTEVDKIRAARKVMLFLFGETGKQVELSVGFARRLLDHMVLYMNALIRDRVMVVSKLGSEEKSRLSRRGMQQYLGSDLLQIHSVVELEECDAFLRQLRVLQEDLYQQLTFEKVESPPELAIPCPTAEQTSKLLDADSIEHVVERALITNTPCLAYHWVSRNRSFLDHLPGEYLRSMSQLIAYQFISASSEQLDSFFVGMHILRNSGENVGSVLMAIFRHTALKFIRDRIFSHLRFHLNDHSVRNMLADTELESLYSNNCYVTELNRGWTKTLSSRLEGPNVKFSTFKTDASPIDCGNIPDTVVTKQFEKSGKIGSITADESSHILKCAGCVDDRRTSVGTIAETEHGDGYLHMTLAWMERMNVTEVNSIIMEKREIVGLNFFEKLHFYVRRREYDRATRLVEEEYTEALGEWEIGVSDNAFLGRIYREAYWLRRIRLDPGFVNVLPHRTVAALGCLLSTESPATSPSAKFHSTVIQSLMSKVNPPLPNVLQLYLRRYQLGDSELEANEISACCPESPWLRILVLGRLGNAQLEHVSRLMGNEADPTVQIAEWMFTGDAPRDWDSVLAAYPVLQPFRARPLVEEVPSATSLASSVYELQTFKKDTSLKDLLGDVYPGLSFADQPPVDLEAGESGVDEIEYLISQGRPSLAYHVLSNREEAGTRRDLTVTARRVAFYNLFQDGVVASAVSFLDLCGQPTETLRVDVQAARSILGSSDSVDVGKVTSLFLAFTGDGSSSLLTALKLLEEAAWAQESPTGPNEGHGFESPWHLVALFCRVHNLPRSLTLLHELARSGDWVMFLHESDLQQCPSDTVKDVINFYFTQSPLRSHLNILLRAGEARPVQPDTNEEMNEFDVRSPKAAALKSLTCPGLDCVVRNDPAGWLLTQPTASSVVQERQATIFNGCPDKGVLFEKYFRLFRFEQARLYYDETESGGLDHLSVGLGFSSPLLQREFAELTGASCRASVLTDESDLMGSLRSNLTATSPSTFVDSILTDDEEGYVDMHLVEQKINQLDLKAIDGFLKKDEYISVLLELLVHHVFKSDPLSEEQYLDAASIVHIDLRELLGDAAMELAECSDPGLESHYVCLAYMAYTSGFVNDEKFASFIQAIKEKNFSSPIDIPELAAESHYHVQLVTGEGSARLEYVDEVNRNGRKADELVVVADEILLQTEVRLDRPNELVQALGAVIQVSQVYRSLGLLQKHLAINEVGRVIASRLGV